MKGTLLRAFGRITPVFLGLLLLVRSATFAADPDPIEAQLRAELRELQTNYDRAIQAKRAEAIRKYEAQLAAAERENRRDLITQLRAKIVALKNEAAGKPAPALPSNPSELRVVGAWVLENAQGRSVADMQIEKLPDNSFKLTRLGGGALAVDGKYTLQGDRLVRMKAAGDPNSDLVWRLSGTKIKLIEGQYKDWVLRRDKK